MALIKFETNISVHEDRSKAIRQNLSRAVAKVIGVAEAEVRVETAGDRKMRIAEGNDPIAHIEMRGVDFPKERARDLVQAICPVLDDVMGIREKNVYIAVISTRNSMWRVDDSAKNQSV